MTIYYPPGLAPALIPTVPSGQYFIPIGLGSSTTNTLPQGFLYLSPWIISKQVEIVRIGLEVTTIGDVGSKCRLGIYGDNGSYYPGALILDAGQVAGDSAAVQEITVDQVLPAGVYWIGAAGQVVSATAPTVRHVSVFSPVPPIPIGASAPTAGLQASSWSQSGVTGALPGSFTASGVLNARAPRLFMKAA